MQNKKLTVIMPVYNHGEYVEEAIGAILGQSEYVERIILCDDGSTDNTRAALNRYIAMDEGVMLGMYERIAAIDIIKYDYNAGAPARLGEMLAMCTTEYVYCASASDVVMPGLFERSTAMLNKHYAAGMCTSLASDMFTGYVDPASRVSDRPVFFEFSDVLRMMMKHETWLNGNTCIYRRDSLVLSGGFEPELGPFCDGFVQKVIALKYGCCFVPEVGVRVRPAGYSAQTARDKKRTTEIIDLACGMMMYSDRRDLCPARLWRIIRRLYLFSAYDTTPHNVIARACYVLRLGLTRAAILYLWRRWRRR